MGFLLLEASCFSFAGLPSHLGSLRLASRSCFSSMGLASRLGVKESRVKASRLQDFKASRIQEVVFSPLGISLGLLHGVRRGGMAAGRACSRALL